MSLKKNLYNDDFLEHNLIKTDYKYYKKRRYSRKYSY